MKITFTLPTTKLCTVIWYRNGQKNKTLIPTPANNAQLVNTMLMDHRVGFSEIRAVAPVNPSELVGAGRF